MYKNWQKKSSSSDSSENFASYDFYNITNISKLKIYDSNSSVIYQPYHLTWMN